MRTFSMLNLNQVALVHKSRSQCCQLVIRTDPVTWPQCTWKWGRMWTNWTYESPPKQFESSLYSDVKSFWRFEFGLRFATWFACDHDVCKAGTGDCVIGSSELRSSGLKPNSALNSGLKIVNVWSSDVKFRIKFVKTLFWNSPLVRLCSGQFITVD